MIVFSCIIPHSPLLVPSIGKENRAKLAATLAACEDIEKSLYAAKPDALCIIAPHGAIYPDAFSVNLAAKYVGSLKAFGDFSTTVTAKSDYLLIDRIQHKLRLDKVPFTLTSNEDLDYSFAIPLLLLASHLENLKIVPVSPSLLDGKAHYAFGTHLKGVLHAEDERVAIIASADLSHKLTSESPGGSSPEGQRFDDAAKQAITATDPTAFLGLSKETLEGAGQCAFRPVAILLGVLDETNVKRTLISYEAPFGVGYLTAKFEPE